MLIYRNNRLVQAILLILLLFLSFFNVSAQTITGTVIDAETDEPLSGANIVQAGTRNGTSSGADGSFELVLLEEAGTKIRISYVGYKTKTLDVRSRGSELTIALVPATIISNEVFVKALRVDEGSPIAYENITRNEIEEKNLGQDIPYLLRSTPSVTTTSDAGAGIGYTGVRIRGIDQTRINVTINGIPLNDAESQNVFWVDLPDLASSVENIQIQRGVGTSTNGAGAFGATMNLQTSQLKSDPYGKVTSGLGSFGTRKVNVQLGSGLLENGWQFEGRLSKIDSDGYINRATSDLRSFYLSGAYHGDKSLLKIDSFSGKEETYQAWNGVPEPIIQGNRQGVQEYVNQLFLPEQKANHFLNNVGNRRFNEFTYDNQVDNYQQDHVQVHYSRQLTENWNGNISLHYTRGRGFFEEFRINDPLGTYNIDPVQIGGETITNSDLVRRRWLDNDFYGLVFSTQYEHQDNWSLTVGGGYNEYEGRHFGEVIQGEFVPANRIGQNYYDNDAVKTDFNVYAKGRYFFTSALSGFLDLQVRNISYNFLGKDTRLIQGNEQIVDVQQTDHLTFFNPKGGLVYRLKDNQKLYASLSVANREPSREEYVESTPESRPMHETLFDWEFGYRGEFDRFFVAANLYHMDYKNQLVLTGEVNDVGAFIRQNVPDSYRTGVELQTGVQISPMFDWSGNATFSRNKIDKFTQFLSDFDEGGQISKEFENTDLSFSPSFIGNSILSFQWSRFSADWIGKYVSRQFLDNTQSKSRSIDPYLINDLRIGYVFSDLPYLKRIKATLEVNNLLDEKYETNGYTFGWKSGGEERHFNFFYPQAGRNFLMQVSFEF